MAAYMIVTASIADRDRFVSGYGAAAARLVERYGGRYVLRGGGAIALEGGVADGASMVISEWPSKEAALAFWNSADYAEVRKLRDGLASVQVMLIEAPRIGGDGA